MTQSAQSTRAPEHMGRMELIREVERLRGTVNPRMVALVDSNDKLRARLTRIADWADNYDGEIAGTIRAALDPDATGWWDSE